MYNVSVINIANVGDSLHIKKSNNNGAYVEAPETVTVKQSAQTLTIEGEGYSENGNFTISGGNDVSGNIFSSKKITKSSSDVIISNSGGKSVKIMGGKVWIDGKLVSGNEDEGAIKEEDMTTIVYIPDGISLTIQQCEKVDFEDNFNLSVLTIQAANQDEVNVRGVTTNSCMLNSSGQSELKVVSCKSNTLIGTSSGQSTLKIKGGEIIQSTLTSSGQSTLKVKGELLNVVANSSGQSSCEFSQPNNPAITNQSGQSNCRTF